ncbi:uncharacterized protein LOC142345480 [Convolutriloba macropyga]|uniref:uncharacterized protein LOC142345480 n=1 Tax=Convolutriloba macropyga TaxID=536237 RepID=UPI003F51DE38
MGKKLTIKFVSFNTIVLYLSAFLTLCFMVMCLLSAWFSMVSLKEKIGVYMNEFKATKVQQYDAPAIMFLANGVYTYECITSHFRFDPRTTYQDFDFEGRDPEDPRLRIQDSCHENFTDYSITLAEFSTYETIIREFPDWLQKNLVTTADDSGCRSEEEEEEGARRRVRRDHTDDLNRCDGDCKKIWECANEPSICVEDQTFDICFTSTHLLVNQEPCITHRKCIGSKAKLPAVCGQWIDCMHPNTIDEVECLPVWDCFYSGEREFGTLCYEIFQCLEDQVQDQCQILTTAEPEEISEEQLAQACDDVNTVMQSQPGLANQDNEPLKLIIMKGPSEYQQRDFLYASLRPASTETGVWATLHHNYDQLIHKFNSMDKFSFLGYIVGEFRWAFLAREFRSFNFMTKTEYKIDGTPDDISIRQEVSMSKINMSDPKQSDYRPVEVYYSWKDGYQIEGNKFIAVTVWDAFSFIAATLLMLERAWLTWGRLMNKVVDANAKRVMKKYEVGSPEWIIFQKMMHEGGNLLQSMMVLRRLKEEEKRQARLAYKRALAAKRQKEKEDKFRIKLERMKALKYGIVSDEVLNWDEKRRVEWLIYKKMVKSDYERNREFYDQMSQKEREDWEREEQKRQEREKKWEKKMERYRQRASGSSASGSTRDALSDEDEQMGDDSDDLLSVLDSEKTSSAKGPKFQGNFMTRAKLQEQMKQKRTKKVNMEFSMPEKREEIEITTGSHVVTDNSSVGKSPWAAKNNSSKNNNSNRSTEKEKQQKPSDWLNKMFDKS